MIIPEELAARLIKARAEYMALHEELLAAVRGGRHAMQHPRWSEYAIASREWEGAVQALGTWMDGAGWTVTKEQG